MTYILACEGKACQHTGSLYRVHVKNPIDKYDWGEFIYCETAIKSDRESGLTVTILEYLGEIADNDAATGKAAKG